MASNITTVFSERVDTGGRRIHITLECLSASDGTITSWPFGPISGTLIECWTYPGSVTPSSNFDVTIADAYGATKAVNLACSATARTDVPITPIQHTFGVMSMPEVDGLLYLTAANAGDSKTFYVHLIVEV